MNNNQNNDGFILFSIVVFLIIGVISGIVYWIQTPYRETREMVTAMSRTAMDDLADNSTIQHTDAWGNPVQFHRIVREDSITQIVTSPGPDGKFGTEDDISHSDTDHNMSKIAGKWIHAKGKEFVKGLIGHSEPSRFDKMKPEPATKPSLWQRIKG